MILPFTMKLPLQLLAVTGAVTAVSAMPAKDNHGPHDSSYGGHNPHSHHGHHMTASYPSGSEYPSHGSLMVPSYTTASFEAELYTPIATVPAVSQGLAARKKSKSFKLESSALLPMKTVSRPTFSVTLFTPQPTASEGPATSAASDSTLNDSFLLKKTSASSASSFKDKSSTALHTYIPIPTFGIKKGGGAAGFRGVSDSLNNKPDTEDNAEPPSYDSLYGGDSGTGEDLKHTTKGGAKASSTKGHKPSNKPSKTGKGPNNTGKPKAGKPGTSNSHGTKGVDGRNEMEFDDNDVLPFPLGGGLYPIPHDNEQKSHASSHSSHGSSAHGSSPKKSSSWTMKSGGSKVIMGGMATVLVLLVHRIF
ncbi:hypothetical protein F5Y08DRAFT_142098 [Xylaria arbuscula]|nr:hypothetical protein F5Y08DRAFT_142098 [Xylaria arbuscula]